jgi:hypothetical protein
MFCALDPPWTKSEAPAPVQADLQRVVPGDAWALLPPDSYGNCVQHLIGFFGGLGQFSQELDKQVYQNLMIAKNTELEALSKELAVDNRIERMLRLLHRASAMGIAAGGQNWVRVLAHLFSVLALVGDDPAVADELRAALPSPARVSEALGVGDVVARLESLARVVLEGPARLKTALNEAFRSSSEQGVQHTDIDSVHSAMLVSRDFLSIFAANADAAVCVLEFAAVYAEFLAELGAGGAAAAEMELPARELEASVTLRALVAAPGVRFPPVADFAAPWVRLIAGLLNADVARPALADFVPFPDFSRLLVDALAAIDRLHVDVAGSDAPSADFARALEDFRGALLQALAARTFPYHDLIEKFAGVAETARARGVDVARAVPPVHAFIRHFHVVWRLAQACAPGAAAPLLSAVVGNFLIGVRAH